MRAISTERVTAPRPFVEEARACPLSTPTTTRSSAIVPRVERGEQINVGVILSCVDVEFLEARIELDTTRLLALDPALDLEEVRAGLATIPLVCAGGPDAGPIGALRAARSLPLAGLAAQHDHPDVGGPHRPDRRSDRRPRASAADDGEIDPGYRRLPGSTYRSGNIVLRLATFGASLIMM